MQKIHRLEMQPSSFPPVCTRAARSSTTWHVPFLSHSAIAFALCSRCPTSNRRCSCLNSDIRGGDGFPSSFHDKNKTHSRPIAVSAFLIGCTYEKKRTRNARSSQLPRYCGDFALRPRSFATWHRPAGIKSTDQADGDHARSPAF